MNLTFIAQRNPRRSKDDVTARHVCNAHAPVWTLIRVWFRTEDGRWRIPSDASELDFYCPRCGEPYPTSEEIEEQYKVSTPKIVG